MKSKVQRFTDIPDITLGRQKSTIIHGKKAEVRKPGKPVTPTSYVDTDEETLWADLELMLDAIDQKATIQALFDTDEEAATMGLKMDARGAGRLGVGIAGSKVHFWLRSY